MAKKWYPVIDYETCVECGACVKKCSHGVYESGTMRPHVVVPDACLEGCHGCQKLCPTGAISYVGEGTVASANCGCSCNCDTPEKRTKA